MKNIEFEFEPNPPRGGNNNPDPLEIDVLKKHVTQEEAINFSKKVVIALEQKVKNHNKKNDSKRVTLSQLKDIYCRGGEEDQEVRINDKTKKITCGMMAMAKVNMFLRVRLGGKIKSSYANLKLSELIDMSKGWIPNEEDLAKAEEDIKKYDLDYNFGSTKDLYLDNKSKFNWWFLDLQ